MEVLDIQVLIVGYRDNSIRIWGVSDPKNPKVRKTLHSKGMGVHTILLTKEGDLFSAAWPRGVLGGKVVFFEKDTYKEMSSFEAPNSGEVLRVGDRYFFPTFDEVEVLKFPRTKGKYREVPGKRYKTEGYAALVEYKGRVISGEREGDVRFLGGEKILSFDGEVVTTLVVSGDLLIAGAYFGYIQICDLKGSSRGIKQLKVGTHDSDEQPEESSEFAKSQTFALLVLSSGGGAKRPGKLLSSTRVHYFEGDEGGGVNETEDRFMIWDMETGEKLKMFPAPRPEIKNLVSLGGNLIATSSQQRGDSQVLIFDLESLQVLSELNDNFGVHSTEEKNPFLSGSLHLAWTVVTSNILVPPGRVSRKRITEFLVEVTKREIPKELAKVIGDFI